MSIRGGEPARGRSAEHAFFDYEAYDNLTWIDEQVFIDSISNPQGMARVAENEVGRRRINE